MTEYIESENVVKCKARKTGLSVEEILREELNISGRLFRRLKKKKSILVNGKKDNKFKKLNKDDEVVILFEDEKEIYKPQNITLDVIYEDFDLMIINKQSNIVVHPTKSHSEETIANGVSYYFKTKGINKKVRFINRLDMNTSGVLAIAKNPFGHQQMALQFENDDVEKRYIAVVNGIINDEKGVIDKPIGKDENDPIKNMVIEHGKTSITKYKVLQRFDNATLVELEIKTGRTHQIRVHLAHIGHPIIGDTLYYAESNLIKRQALHAYSLKFRTPRTGELIKVNAELPEDMNLLLDRLRK